MATRYQNLGQLADGGMADIELARDIQRDQLVAIKRIKQRHCHDPEFTRMFDDEARVWAQLKHPNIVALLDHGCDERGPFIAMELVDGCDLVALLHTHLDAGLPLDLSMTIATSLLDALSYLHEAEDSDDQALHLVHRDISPGNVLCARAGPVKLTDFGVVQARIKTHETRAGDLKGKFAYMSPEQTRGQPLSAASDLFSAGVVLWEMLAGRPLFDRATDIDTAQAVREARVPALAGLRSNLPPEIDALLGEMLQVDPEKRSLSAQSAAQSLRRIAREHGLRLGPEIVCQAVESCVADQAPLLQRVQLPERRQTRLTSSPLHGTRPPSSGASRAALVVLVLAAVALGAWQIAWRNSPKQAPGPELSSSRVSESSSERARSESLRPKTNADASTAEKVASGPADVQPSAPRHFAPPAAHSATTKPPRPRPRPPSRHPSRHPSPSPLRPRPASNASAHAGAHERPLSATPKAKPPAQVGIGWLDISSEPWAKIAVDGVAIDNNTPLRGYALPAGRHRITLHNPVFDITRSIEISIEAGQHLRRRVDLMPR